LSRPVLYITAFVDAAPPLRQRDSDVVVDPLTQGRTVMKTVVSALIALSVLAGIAGSAAALDAKTFYEQQDRAQH